MRTANFRVIFRHIIVFSLLIFLGMTSPGYLKWLKADCETTAEGLPTLRGEAATGAAGDFFGGSVDISGDTAIVGAHLGDAGAIANQGAAYVFMRGAGTWSQLQKLTAPHAAAGDLFGVSVALDAETAVIGARQDTVSIGFQGSAYIFARGVTWTERQKLTASDGGFNDEFGATVAISGNTVVIGAHYADTDEAFHQGADGKRHIQLRHPRNGQLWVYWAAPVPDCRQLNRRCEW